MSNNRQINIAVEALVPRLLDGCQQILCGNGGYTINFLFDEEWQEYDTKTAIFVCGKNTFYSVFKGSICKVPEIDGGTDCYIGVVSGDFFDDGNVEKISTSWLIIDALPTIGSIAQEPTDPPKDVYVEFMALLNASGIPKGGSKGQVLKKASNDDYDAVWQDDILGSGGTVVTVGGKGVSEFDADTKANVSQLQEDSYYELVLTSENYTGVSQLNQATARTIKVVGLTINEDILLPSVVERIDFIGCNTNGAIRHDKTYNDKKAELYWQTGENADYYAFGEIYGFTLVDGANDYINITANVVRNCICREIHGQYAFNSSAESIYSKVVEKCDAGTFYGCDYVINCYIQVWQSDVGVENCKNITGMTGETIVFKNCSHIQNIVATNRAEYIDCTYIDFSTCTGAVLSSDVGKVPVLTTDGSFSAKSVYSTDEVDAKVGDIDAALDSIIAMQEALIGGNA
jgi:hypothetical protein